MSDKLLRPAVAVISAGILGFLLWLLYVHPATPGHSGETSSLPLLNAAFNLLCAICLVGGYRSIRAGRRNRHIAFMLAAVLCSSLSLAGYVTHHYTAGDTPFGGQGFIRPVYFAILISHVLVTTITLPMILLTLAHAASGRFIQHKRLARRTLPLWLYVSATGVLVFVFLRLWE